MNRLLPTTTISGLFEPTHKSVNSGRKPMKMIVIVPSANAICHISCEEDSDGISSYRDEPDPDDMTDYGYYHRYLPKKTWSPPGYGDDD